MAREHRLDESLYHTLWDNALPPALTIDPGDTVHFQTRDVSDGQITPGCGPEVLSRLDRTRSYPLAGPVAIRGALPGDALVVEIVSLETMDWAWTGIFPGRGLLPDDFTAPYLHHWDLTNGRTSRLKPGVEIPLDPFPGTIGVAPSEPGQHRVGPPGRFGGNLDVRDLRAGTTLYLPIQVAGALFSVGDCHAAQGDGEVSITGLEAPMRLTLRFDLLKGAGFAEPRFVTRGPIQAELGRNGYYATTGIGPDLYTDAQQAVRAMIDWLGTLHGLTREEAYVLASAVGDLKISEIVDAPNWVVSFYVPRSVFVDGR